MSINKTPPIKMYMSVYDFILLQCTRILGIISLYYLPSNKGTQLCIPGSSFIANAENGKRKQIQHHAK